MIRLKPFPKPFHKRVMAMDNGILRRRFVREVYDVVCAHPEGIRMNEVVRVLPHIPEGQVRGSLMRLRSECLISSRRETDKRSIWRPIR